MQVQQRSPISSRLETQPMRLKLGQNVNPRWWLKSPHILGFGPHGKCYCGMEMGLVLETGHPIDRETGLSSNWSLCNMVRHLYTSPGYLCPPMCMIVHYCCSEGDLLSDHTPARSTVLSSGSANSAKDSKVKLKLSVMTDNGNEMMVRWQLESLWLLRCCHLYSSNDFAP